MWQTEHSAHSCLWPTLLILVQERKKVDVLSAEYELSATFLYTSLTREKKFMIQKQTDGRRPELPSNKS